MMKLAIFEDRIERLEQFTTFKISEITEVEVITGGTFKSAKADLESGNNGFLEKFCCIAWHQSTLTTALMDQLKSFCKETGKALVFFSGSITSSRYVDNSFPYLTINSKDFYSKNLQLFLQDLKDGVEPNLLKIQFGDRWKLSILLSLRNKINVAINREILAAAGLDEVQAGEGIRRTKDLGINKLIFDDLKNNDTKDLFAKDDFAQISLTDVRTLLTTINQKINLMA